MTDRRNNKEKRKLPDSRSYQRTQMQREIIIEKLRERGCRITKQRLTLLDIILKNECSSCKGNIYMASKVDEENRRSNGIPHGECAGGDRSHQQKKHV